ncbi:MAG: PAS domain S-box protein [Cytophagales bacterium]|nr:PAS domain S-box protein [Cytophagales bacterium]
MKITNNPNNIYFSLSPVASFLIDKSGRCKEANPAALTLCGYSKKQLELKSITDFISDIGGSKRTTLLNRIVRKKLKEEVNLWKKDGSSTSAILDSVRISDNEFLVHCSEIPIREEVRQKFNSLDELQTRMSQLTNMGAWEWDVVSNNIVWTDQMFHIYGLEESRIPSIEEVSKLIRPDDLDSFNQAIQDTLSGNPPEFIIYRVCTKKGVEKHLKSTAHLTKNSKNEPIKLFGTLQDVTSAEKANAALTESDSRYRSLFESSPVALWEEDFSEVKILIDSLKKRGVKDFKKYFDKRPEVVEKCALLVKVIEINDAVKELHEASSKEELLSNISALFTPESYESFKKELVVIAEGGNEIEFDTTIKTINGDVKNIHLKFVFAPRFESNWDRAYISMTDITERKLSVEKLRESEEHFREFANSLPQTVWEIDMSGKVTFVNTEGFKTFGFTDKDFEKGVRSFDLFSSGDKARGIADAQKCLAGENVRNVEYLLHRKDGTTIPVLMYMWAIRKDGQLVGLRGMHIDITDRKIAETTLIESEKKWRALTQNSPDYIMMLDLNSQILFINHTEPDLELDEVIGKSQYDFIPSGEHQRIRDCIQGIIERGNPDEYETEYHTKEGKIDYYHVRVSPLKNDDDLVYGFINAATNITEQKKAVSALEESERLFRAVVTNSKPIIFIFDSKGKILLSEGEMLASVGMKPGEMVGQNVFEAYKDLPAVIKEFKRVLKGESFEGKLAFGELMFESIFTPNLDSEGKIIEVIGSAINITERNKMEVALLESEEKWRSLTENSPDYIMMVDLDLRLLFINRTVPDLQAEDVIGKSILDYIAPGYDQLVIDCFNRVKLTGQNDSYETQYISNDGVCEYIFTRLSPLKGDNGKVVSFVTTSTNITEQKNARLDLQASQEHLQRALEAARAGTWEWNKKTNKNVWSDETYELMGYSPNIGETDYEFWLRCIHPDDRKLINKSVSKTNKSFEDRKLEYRVVRPDGAIHWISDIGRMTIDSKGNTTNTMFGIMLDITERKNVEESLAKQMIYYEELINNSPGAIAVLDAQKRVSRINSYFTLLFGYEEKEVLGKPIDGFIVPDKFLEQAKNLYKPEFLEELGGSPLESMRRHKDGTLIDVSIVGSVIIIDKKPAGIYVTYLDARKSKRAEEELKASEVLLRESQKAAAIGSYNFNVLTGKWISSETLDDLFGIDEKFDRTFEGWLSIVHPEDREMIQKYFTNQALRRNNPFNEDYRIRRVSDQQVRWVHGLSSLEYDEDGNLKNIIGTIQDISERKKSEQALVESEEVYRELFDSSFDSIFISEKGICLKQNATAEKMFGYSDSEAVGKSGTDWIAEGDREMVLNNMIAGYDKPYEAMALRKDGSVFHAEIQGGLTKYKGSEARIITLQDISWRIKAEETLVETEERYSELFNVLPIGSEVVDLKGNVLACNPNFARMLGYGQNELVGMHVTKYFHPHSLSTFNEKYQSVLKGNIEQGNVILIHKDGQNINVIRTAKPIYDAEGKVTSFLLVTVDITEQKLEEETLEKIERLKSVGSLAGGIAHDFNNILTGVAAYISLVKDEFSKADNGYKFLEEAEGAVDMAKTLTKQLLTFAKGGEPIKAAVGLGDLIRQVVKFDLSGSNVKPRFKESDDLWIAEIDKGQIQQVFSNLTINAKQAMPDGGNLYIIMENCKVPSNSLKEGNYIRVTVRDEGSGISATDVERIFDPYFSTKKEGSGLGLATVHSIINKHGGQIMVESELKKGTKFTLYLPTSDQKAVTNVELPKKKTSDMKKAKKVLILDDVKMLLDVMTQILEANGFEVVTSEEGSKTIELYKEAFDTGKPFDVVIMDLTIPGGLGGKEAIKEIVKIDPDVKAIVSSGYAVDPIIANYTDYGFKEAIIKPFNKDDLMVVLDQVLG